MSNARRRIARSGWQGPNRRSTLMQAPPPSDLEAKQEAMAMKNLQSEIIESPHQEMMPLEALFECAREARDKGFRKGFAAGLISAGLVSLAIQLLMWWP